MLSNSLGMQDPSSAEMFAEEKQVDITISKNQVLQILYLVYITIIYYDTVLQC